MATNLQTLFVSTQKSFKPSVLKVFETPDGIVESDLTKPTINGFQTSVTYSNKTGTQATLRNTISGPFGSKIGALLPDTASAYSGIILDASANVSTNLSDFGQSISISTWFANKDNINYPKVIVATSGLFNVKIKDSQYLTVYASELGVDAPDLSFADINFNVDEWHYITIVCDSDASLLFVYVDGVLATEGPVAYTPNAAIKIKKIALGAIPGLTAETWPNPVHSGFSGMRNMAFASATVWYNRALSGTEVSIISNLGANSNLVTADTDTEPGTLDATIAVSGAISKTIVNDTVQLSVPVAITSVTAENGITAQTDGTTVTLQLEEALLPSGMVKANPTDSAPDYLNNKITVDSGLALDTVPAAVGPAANVFYVTDSVTLNNVYDSGNTKVTDGDLAVVSMYVGATNNASDATVYARINSEWILQSYSNDNAVESKFSYVQNTAWPPQVQPAAPYAYGSIALVGAESTATLYAANTDTDGQKGKLYFLINPNAWNSQSGWREIIPPAASFVKLSIDYPALVETVALSETFTRVGSKVKTTFKDELAGFLKEKIVDGENTTVDTQNFNLYPKVRYYSVTSIDDNNEPEPPPDEVNPWKYGNILIMSEYADAATFILQASAPVGAKLYLLAHEPANQATGTVANDWIELTDTGATICYATSVEELPTVNVPAGCFAVVAADLNNTLADIYQENNGNWQLYRDKNITTSTVAKINVSDANIIDIVSSDNSLVRTANALTTIERTADHVRETPDESERIADKFISLRTVNRLYRPADQTAMYALSTDNKIVVSGDISILGNGTGVYVFNGKASETNWQNTGQRRPYAAAGATESADWELLISGELINLPPVVDNIQQQVNLAQDTADTAQDTADTAQDTADKAIDERNYVTPEQFGAQYDAGIVTAYTTALSAQNAAQLTYNTAVTAQANAQNVYNTAKTAYDAAVATQNAAQAAYDAAVLGGDEPTIAAALIVLNDAIANTSTKLTLRNTASTALDTAIDDTESALNALNIAIADTADAADALATLNTTPWLTAIATGKRILCKKDATYFVETLTLDNPNQIIDLNGATLKLIDTIGIDITASNCCICNGTIDGQKVAARTGEICVKIQADNTKIHDVCIKRGGALAIDLISGNNVIIENNLFLNNFEAALLCHQSTNIKNIAIINNICDTTEIGAAHTLGGFMVHQQDSPYYFDGVLISGNTVRRLQSSGTDVTANMVGIEVYGDCRNARVIDNLIIGGSIGITIANGAQTIVDGNCCKYQTLIGIELAKSNNSVVSNNICEGLSSGQTENGITCTACISPRSFTIVSGQPKRRPLYDAYGNIIPGVIISSVWLLKHPDSTLEQPIAMPGIPNFVNDFVVPDPEDMVELVPGESIIIRNPNPVNGYTIDYTFTLPNGDPYQVVALTDIPPLDDGDYGISAGPDTCSVPWAKLTCTIIGNTISNCEFAIHLQNNTHSKVANNKMSGITLRGIRCSVGTEYTSITGNTFEGASPITSSGPLFVILEASTATQINNNIVDGCYNFLRYYTPTAYTVQNIIITGNMVVNKTGIDIQNASPAGILTLPTEIIVKNNIGLTDLP